MFLLSPLLLTGVKPHGRKFHAFVPGGRSGHSEYVGTFLTALLANAAVRAGRRDRGQPPPGLRESRPDSTPTPDVAVLGLVVEFGRTADR
jgi:hypothetical protein